MHLDGSYEVRLLTEEQEVEFRRLGRELEKQLGPDRYHDFLMSLFEEHEDAIRGTSPDGPAMQMLDAHRRKQGLGFE